MSTSTRGSSNPLKSRWFYSAASLLLLILTLIGFRHFYLHLQAYPGRPLPEAARHIFIVHGVAMTMWILLSVAQPVLVATGRKRVHMRLGKFAMVLAAGIVVSGYLIAIGSTRQSPPELMRFGLAPREFLVVPLSGILAFGLFVTVGVVNRRRPEVHRPMMFLASLAVVAAALGRIPIFSVWYSGTILERWLSAFVAMLVLGALLLAAKGAIERRIDRYFAGGLAVLFAICWLASLLARTHQWDRFAAILCR